MIFKSLPPSTNIFEGVLAFKRLTTMFSVKTFGPIGGLVYNKNYYFSFEHGTNKKN